MNIIYDDDVNGFYIENPYNKDSSDKAIAKVFNVPYTKYIKMLKNGGATSREFNNEYYFETKEDAQSFLNSDEMLPYIVLLKISD